METLARSVAMEMDLRLEAAALSEFAENTASDRDFRVPAVDWRRTARDVLTTGWIDGTPLSDIAALDAAGQDRRALARILIQSFLTHAMRDGFFHADMHPGNLFLDDAGRLVAVDFGIMGRLGLKERRFLADILYGFITRDYRMIAQRHFDIGYVPRHQSVDDFALALRIHRREAPPGGLALGHADHSGEPSSGFSSGGGGCSTRRYSRPSCVRVTRPIVTIVRLSNAASPKA